LAGNLIGKARRTETAGKEREEFVSKALRLFNKADSIDSLSPVTWLGKAASLLVRGQFEKARDQFKVTLDQVPSSQIAKYKPNTPH